jgi:hypothetical protein
MELKDVILSTLAEMEESQAPKPTLRIREMPKKETLKEETQDTSPNIKSDNTVACESEIKYLNSIKERLLVLFEGFQAPNNTNIEAKIDMTLNFLEYTLATIDSRVEILEKGKRQ